MTGAKKCAKMVMTIKHEEWNVQRVDIPHTPKETVLRIDPNNIKQQTETVMKENTERKRHQRHRFQVRHG
ncbi:MAG: hypothetical protein IKH57_15435 [Clostridia bacterium]|nr:hypothetical protein [Clostridia bacterium]